MPQPRAFPGEASLLGLASHRGPPGRQGIPLVWAVLVVFLLAFGLWPAQDLSRALTGPAPEMTRNAFRVNE
ncbi:MAG: hypothetical protein A3H94_03525 [Acidobacteria bacterium RIFCSPLOWO2_02_FULL_60_20]|nr:MAG: hypothetical protein A3H94_03525 [Acidobacteria bacterium RIFCSPLOWO2_02_FULL_60_20]